MGLASVADGRNKPPLLRKQGSGAVAHSRVTASPTNGRNRRCLLPPGERGYVLFQGGLSVKGPITI